MQTTGCVLGAGVLQAPGNVNTLVNGVKPDGTAASTLDRAQSGGSLASLAANGTKLAADGVSSYATSQVAGNIAQSGVKGPVAQAAANLAARWLARPCIPPLAAAIWALSRS